MHANQNCMNAKIYYKEGLCFFVHVHAFHLIDVSKNLPCFYRITVVFLSVIGIGVLFAVCANVPYFGALLCMAWCSGALLVC